MAAGDLTTLVNVKSWLGITSTTDDALLTRLITAESSYIQTWISRTIASTAYNETRSGSGTPIMVTAQYPIISVSSLKINENTIPATTSALVPGYMFLNRTITLIGYVFTNANMNVKIAYTAGYATTPPDIEQACIELVSIRYRERDRIGASSKSIGGESISYITDAFPDSVRVILNNYKDYVPV